MAQRECSFCHAIGTEGPSPRSDAPPFRIILSRYHSDTLAPSWFRIARSSRYAGFELNPKAVDSLVVYLKSIQQK